MSGSPVPRSRPRRAVFRNRRFVELWLGTTVSLFGDYYYFVALPWLVLQIAGSSFALGAVMMTAAIPRAALMLMGGAVIDRFSARTVLLVTALGRAAVVATIAALTTLHRITLWHLYALEFLFGTADAFSMPAANALVPSIVDPADLRQANAVTQATTQATTMAAPAPAGWLVTRWGVATALWADAASFLAVVVALARLPSGPRQVGSARGPGMLASIHDGFRYVLRDVPLRNMMLMIGALNFCTTGPFNVGLAWLAKSRFGSATAYGAFLSSYGAGALAGMVLAGTVKTLRHRGMVLLIIPVALGVGMPLIGLVPVFPVVALAMAAIGLSGGFASIVMTAWMQERIDAAYRGRVMSLFMFCALGLMPVSLLVSGALAASHLPMLFAGAGFLIALTGLVSALSRATRSID